jgi:hypothetical protein
MFVIVGENTHVIVGPFGSRREAERFLTKRRWSTRHYRVVKLLTPDVYVEVIR